MIYQVNGYNTEPTYFDEANNQNAKADAETLLKQKQVDVLAYEAIRFSVCATFANGNNTTWREVQETDPEDTICQVFDTFTGTYTECANKTEAFNLNTQKQQEFLTFVGLDKVEEIAQMPVENIQTGTANSFGENLGTIPVEVM